MGGNKLLAVVLGLSLVSVAGCGLPAASSAGDGGAQASVASASSEAVGSDAEGASASGAGDAANAPAPVTVTDGSYAIEVDTDSSMFRADSCMLTVVDGAYTAELVLPGEGFSRLFFGTADDAGQADDVDIYDYHLNEDGKYAFTLPVSALDEELQVAAYGQRRDTWYDHTIVFHAPGEAG